MPPPIPPTIDKVSSPPPPRLRLAADPYRAPETDVDPPEHPLPRRSGCALGLVLGLVFWIVVLLAIRVALDGLP